MSRLDTQCSRLCAALTQNGHKNYACKVLAAPVQTPSHRRRNYPAYLCGQCFRIIQIPHHALFFLHLLLTQNHKGIVTQ
jgi:hypothetical protein